MEVNERLDRIEAILENFAKEFAASLAELHKAQLQNEFQMVSRRKQDDLRQKKIDAELQRTSDLQAKAQEQINYLLSIVGLFGEGLQNVDPTIKRTAGAVGEHKSIFVE